MTLTAIVKNAALAAVLVALCGCALPSRTRNAPDLSLASNWYVEAILPSQDGMIWDLDFSADGTQLATACLNGRATLYEAESWRETQSINYGGGCYGVEFSPDANLLLAYGHSDAQIWDIITPRLVDRINCLFEAAFIHDGQQVLIDGYWTGDRNPRAAVGVGPSLYACWDVATQKIARPPECYEFYWDDETRSLTNMPATFSGGNFLSCVTNATPFSYTDDRLDRGPMDERYTLHSIEMGTGSENYIVQLWDQSGPFLVQTMDKTYTRRTEPVAAWFGAGNKDVFVASRRSGASLLVNWFSRETGELLTSSPLPCRWRSDFVPSPSGRVIAIKVSLLDEQQQESHGFAVLANCTTGDIIAKLDGHPRGIRSVAWAPDGQRIATGGVDGRVIVWRRSQQQHADVRPKGRR